MNHFFAYIDRMRYIERWALMRNSVRENIQEHSHQVAVLAHALAVIRNEFFGGQVDAGAVARATPDRGQIPARVHAARLAALAGAGVKLRG